MEPLEVINQSVTLEANAIAAQNGGNIDEAKRLFKSAGKTVWDIIDKIPDDSIRGEQVVRAVRLLNQAGERKRAKTIAQYSLNGNSIPLTSKDELRALINEITNAKTSTEIRNRGRGALVEELSSGLTPKLLTITTPTRFSNVSDILSLPAQPLRAKCAKALQASFTLDVEHDPPAPKSPSQIATEFGVPISLQRQLGICLTKETAYEFMETLGVTPKQGKFYQNLAKKKYKEFFNREISSDGGKPFVFTYAEILHLQEIEALLPFPEELSELLAS
jgi:hypothetical protein